MKMKYLLKFLLCLLIVCFFENIARARQPDYVTNAMVVAQEPFAAEVGLETIKQGGNAVDAAVAVGFALAVTYPYAGNIGGGGVIVIPLGDGGLTFNGFRGKRT